jgi:hypothetical protein
VSSPDEITRFLQADAARFRDEGATLDEEKFTTRVLGAIGAGANPAMNTVTWRWRDYRHQEHPPGWDGRHEMAVRGFATNDEVTGVILACSCGREAVVAQPPDWETNQRRYELHGDDGEISLISLNRLAGDHLWGPAWVRPVTGTGRNPAAGDICGQCDGGLIPVPAGTGCTCDPGPEGQHQPYCGFQPCPAGCWDKLHPPAGGTGS